MALCALLPVVWTFPLVLDLDGAIPGRAGDNLSFLWNFWWMRQALGDAEVDFFRTLHLFAPGGVDLTLHTHTALPALAGATAFGWLPLVAAHNVVLLATLFLNAACAYWLAWRVSGSRGGALCAAAVFGGSPYVMAHLHGHFNLVSAWGLPLFAALLLRTLDGGARRTALAAGAALAAIAYTDYYYLVYALAFALVWLALRWFAGALALDRGAPSPRRLRAARAVLAVLAADGLLAAVILGTGGFVIHVWDVRISATSVHNELTAGWALLLLWGWLRFAPRWPLAWRPSAAPRRDLRALAPAAAVFAAGLAPLAALAAALWLGGGYVSQPLSWRSMPGGIDLLAPVLGNPFHPLWGDAAAAVQRGLDMNLIEGVGWLGVVPAVLVCLAWRSAAVRPAAGPWLAAGGAFLLWALGPFLTVAGANTGLVLPQAFLRFVPILSNARIPGRAMVLVFLALAVVCALVVADLGRRRRRWPRALAAALAAGIVLDYLAAPFPLTRLERPAIYRTLAAAEGSGTVLELPAGLVDGVAGETGVWRPRVLFHQTLHGRPLVGGAVARLPPAVRAAHAQAPVVGALLRLSAGERLAESGADLDAPVAETAAALAAFGVRWVVLDRGLAPPDLVRYVEALPLRLLERDRTRALYVVAEEAAAAAAAGAAGGQTPGPG